MSTAAAPPRHSLSGAFIGSLIGTPFGVTFLLINGSQLPSPGFAVTVGIAIAGTLAVLITAWRQRDLHLLNEPPTRAGEGFGRTYWAVVVAEAVALFAGLFVMNRTGYADYGVAWVATLVGLHFLPLGRLWREPVHYVTGVLMTALGVTGLILALADTTPWVVSGASGVGAGAVLLAAAVYGVSTGGRAGQANTA